MNEVNDFIENAINWRNHRRREMSQAKENQTNELISIKENLITLEDETKKCRETIEKNFNSIMSHKHSIHKTQDSINEMGLPISNTYHDEFLNFLSNTVSFINKIGDNKHNSECDMNESELSCKCISNVQICNENVMKFIHKENNAIDEVQTIMDNINTVKEYCTPTLEDEISISESTFCDGL